MRISLIVAMAENGVIGSQGHLPWKLSGDLKRFKNVTMSHALLMGRTTYDSIGRPLPGRTSIILTRNRALEIPGCQIAYDWEDACRHVPAGSDLFVIGGQQIYDIALPFVQRIYLTQVHASVAGDTFFPRTDWSCWRLVYDEPHAADERNEYPFSFRMFDRIRTS